MVRTEAPLVERMTLVWHDWFATSKSGVPQRLMLRQNALLRRHALGNFEQLALDITKDPAMLLWLNGTSNNRGTSTRTTRVSCRSCSASAPAAATASATCASSPAR